MNILKKINLDKKLIENFLSLTTLQLFNIVIPILLIPFLYKTLGVDIFALIMISQALCSYFLIIIDYGFNLSATRFISINRDNPKILSEILSSVIIIKTLLIVISFFAFYLIVVNFENYKNYTILFTVSFLVTIFQSLFPSWFFQGIEEMKYITITSSTLKIIGSISIFFVIKKESDYILYPLIFSITAFISTLWAYIILIKKHNVFLKFPGIKVIKNHFKDSTGFFISRIAVTSYTTINLIILSFFCSTTTVGFYSVAEKIYMAIRSLYQPMSTALYPYIAYKKNIQLFKKIFIFLLTINTIGVIVLYVISAWIIYLATGDSITESIIYLKLFSILILIVMPSIFLGYPLLGALGYTNVVNKSVLIPSVFHVSIIAILAIIGAITPLNVIILLFITEALVLYNRLKYTIIKVPSFFQKNKI